MSKKVRRGMHARILWPMLRSGIPEDFSNAESLTLHISRVNTALKTYVPDTHISISGNVVSFIVTAEMLKPLTSGEYRATIAYRKVSATSPTLWEPYIFDQPCFTLVDSSIELGGATSGMEIETIELNGEIGIAKEGLPGASAYRIAVANGFEGDEAEWLYSLKKPSLDAATAAAMAANAANDAADAADAATSELNTVMHLLAQAESGRVQAEQGRVNAESSRQQAEESRRTNEVERNQSETAREQAESTRVQAEQGRSTAESGRVQAEAARNTKEGDRTQSETAREQAESSRVQAEQGRSTAEQAREQAETARTEAESDRETAENARTEAEQSRDTAETAREQAEQSRGTTFTQKIEEAEQATAAANTAAGAQNTYNVTVAIPLAAGSYYTKSTARSAVPTVSRKLGLVITYAIADKVWYSEKYIGSTVAGWTTEENWEYVPTASNLATKTDKTELDQLRSDIAYMYPSVTTSKRVLADGGTIKSRSTLNDLTNKFLDLLPNTKLLFCPHLAVKLRESGMYKYVTKLYDVGPAMLDGSQTTALNQPYLSGNIAPNEKYAIKNPNGANTYITHTPISFSATDKWSLSFVLNNYHNANFAVNKLCFYGQSAIRFQDNSSTLCVVNKNGSATVFSNSSRKCIGKNSHYILSADGLGNMSFYIDGKLITTNTFSTEFEFNIVFSSNQSVNGDIKYYSIRDISLSPTQVQDEYNYLRTLFPEVGYVQIGTQTWATSNCEMTCTPQGNIIPEMQAATNAEKITNAADREFSSDTGFWEKQAGWTIEGGKAVVTSGAKGSALFRGQVLIVGKWYKCSFTIESISGNLQLAIVANRIGYITPGTYTAFLKCDATTYFGIICGVDNTTAVIDNVSFQEIGWEGSTELYNGIYAQTGGTAEQKEYAAVKAAAMWCYYNNDPAIGAIYGKLYNWYAVKLLQMDIDYYNAANPTTPWGWRVPVKEDFDLLRSYLQIQSSGAKTKKEGNVYWYGSNVSTNESGLSLIGTGIRSDVGVFTAMFGEGSLFSSDSYRLLCQSSSSELATNIISKKEIGRAVRLIKA